MQYISSCNYSMCKRFIKSIICMSFISYIFSLIFNLSIYDYVPQQCGPLKFNKTIYVCMCMHVFMYVCMCVCMYVCVYVFMYVCMCVCTCVCMYVCVYVCMYVCVYVCMCVCVYVCMCDICMYV